MVTRRKKSEGCGTRTPLERLNKGQGKPTGLALEKFDAMLASQDRKEMRIARMRMCQASARAYNSNAQRVFGGVIARSPQG
jgi:hypothetical protein